MAAGEPPLTILDYHRLRAFYAKDWNVSDLERAVAADDPTFPERVRELLPGEDEHLPKDPGDAELTPLDGKLTELCQVYRLGGANQRRFILALITRSIGGKLQSFGFRMAHLAVRQQSLDLLRLGLAAHAIDDLASGDVRDELCLLAVMADAARRIGADPVLVFREIAEIAPPASARLFRDFVRDVREVPSLGSMGFRAVEGPDGITYRQF